MITVSKQQDHYTIKGYALDVRASGDPHGAALDFAQSVFRHACVVCAWDPGLAVSAEGTPPPVR